MGTVDRADEWVEEDGTRWVRVVDYKTGTKKLDLKEVYCGLDCQMLLYLFSLTRDAGGRFTGAEPAGVLYLRVEGACYVGIGCLFLLYGFYRAIKRPGMSVVLTVISLGTRVVLAYLLAGPIGEIGIWIAIPIGWVLADLTGYGYYFRHKQKLLPQEQK